MIEFFQPDLVNAMFLWILCYLEWEEKNSGTGLFFGYQ